MMRSAMLCPSTSFFTGREKGKERTAGTDLCKQLLPNIFTNTSRFQTRTASGKKVLQAELQRALSKR